MPDFNLQNSSLGKIAPTPGKYDASLLYRIPRSDHRIKYQIHLSKLSFTGVDVWNCYELSFMTDNGLPVSGILKLIYSAESQYIIESKSLKLYLSSFNMERIGSTIVNAGKNILRIIEADLEKLLETTVSLSFFTNNENEKQAFPEFYQKNLYDLIGEDNLYSMKINTFEETPELLYGELSNNMHEYVFHTDVLRSNCSVTNQPDWGDVFFKMQTKYVVDLKSVLAYLVSFRKEQHFHEDVAEMLYKSFFEAFQPKQLMIAIRYTRRGGIDINPIRASHIDLIDVAFTNPQILLTKTFRQ
ncbi:MAG: NADPH-dependent 7-cyano-7-deazaguanine reductase QueF [Prevotellaceae bacterium]|jgi:7-cyano-7-deazaguanine reductase|nr:NADPH-dependent 7-cyano-7-deazaguanine reductase QueF [Prevotellaceae bacterium]